MALSRDELDTEMLAPVVISTLAEWVTVDMFVVDGEAGSVMIYFIWSADGTGRPFIEGLVLINRQVVWAKMLD